MPSVLLRPHVLGFKNRVIHEAKHRFFGRDAVMMLISAFMIAAIYFGTYSFLDKVRHHPQYDPLLSIRLVSISLFAFFLLLLFSNSIAALGYLFAAKDIPLLLTLPVSHLRLYFARLCEIIATSSWMFILFAVPAVFGFYSALELPWTFLVAALLVFIPFVVIPAALGTILVTLFVNLIPPHRIRDLLVIAAFMIVCVVLFLNNDSSTYMSTDEQQMSDFIKSISSSPDPQPYWLPSKWTTDVLAGFLIPGAHPRMLLLALLFASAVGVTALGFLVFDALFLRGWGMSAHGNRVLRIRSSNLTSILGRIIIPFHPQLRALCFKEARMFVRDTTQSLQLLMLLLLTFVYLYNFRTLRAGSNLYAETLAWWQVILSLANTAFGACVIAAIATRFVFPSVSLEGRAYLIVRATPLTIEQLLRNKFYTWLAPITALAVLLLVSGSWAIYGSFETVVATAVLAVAISIGIVGLGIGVGAVYAKFDWESPSQVTANFGSLVFMLLALGVVMFTMIPSSVMFFLTCVPNFVGVLSRNEYWMLLVGSGALIFFVNYAAAKHAMTAGAQHLHDLEK